MSETQKFQNFRIHGPVQNEGHRKKRQDSEFRYFENIRFKEEKIFYCAFAKNHYVACRETE